VLVFTSAAGARTTPGASLYSSARAAANMLVRNVAAEVADKGVQINAVATNVMDLPEFLKANRAEGAEARARVESMVPMGRLGTLDELAHFSAAFIDGRSRFTTGQFVVLSGVFNRFFYRDFYCATRDAPQTLVGASDSTYGGAAGASGTEEVGGA
jgi:3-oxoacyl-[acyl-carrier protein] reductase